VLGTWRRSSCCSTAPGRRGTGGAAARRAGRLGRVVLGGPLADEHRVVLVVQAESESAVRETLERDPKSETHLRVGSIDPWTLRLDARLIERVNARQ
jgi:hypothetical protein